jgi:predicted alpha/beta hydrolase family esterase
MHQRLMEGELFDSDLAKRMAEEAQERPEVKRWLRRLDRLIKDMPEGLAVFVGESVTVLALGPNGESFRTEVGGVDQSAIVDSFSNRGKWDGGDW